MSILRMKFVLTFIDNMIYLLVIKIKLHCYLKIHMAVISSPISWKSFNIFDSCFSAKQHYYSLNLYLLRFL